MPVLDARALDTDAEGLALLREVLDTAGTGERLLRASRPARDAFDPARRRRALSDEAPAEPVREPDLKFALALGS